MYQTLYLSYHLSCWPCLDFVDIILTWFLLHPVAIPSQSFTSLSANGGKLVVHFHFYTITSLYKGHNSSGTTKWKRCIGQGMGREQGTELSGPRQVPLLPLPACQLCSPTWKLLVLFLCYLYLFPLIFLTGGIFLLLSPSVD